MSGKKDQLEAAAFFMRRASEAMENGEAARSEDARAAFYKEAETWLYMAGRCLDSSTAERPQRLKPPPARVGTERRSFIDD